MLWGNIPPLQGGFPSVLLVTLSVEVLPKEDLTIKKKYRPMVSSFGLIWDLKKKKTTFVSGSFAFGHFL